VQFLARGSGYSLFLGRERAVLALQRRRSHTSVIEMELLGASPLQEPSPLVQCRHAARVVLAEEAVTIAGERTVEKVEYGERDPAEHDGGPEEPRPDRAAGGAVGQQVLGGRSRVGEEIDAVDGVRVSSVTVQRLLREGALEVREVEETMGVMVENEGDDPIADDAHAVDEDDVGADGGNRGGVHAFVLGRLWQRTMAPRASPTDPRQRGDRVRRAPEREHLARARVCLFVTVMFQVLGRARAVQTHLHRLQARLSRLRTRMSASQTRERAPHRSEQASHMGLRALQMPMRARHAREHGSLARAHALQRRARGSQTRARGSHVPEQARQTRAQALRTGLRAARRG
jgi:hypothetical protein